ELARQAGVTERLVARADHDFARLGADGDHVHRTSEAPGELPPLTDRIAREAMVLAYHDATHRDERAGRERGSVGRQVALEHADVVVVRDEADFYRLGLVGRDEPELSGHGTRFPLGELA